MCNVRKFSASVCRSEPLEFIVGHLLKNLEFTLSHSFSYREPIRFHQGYSLSALRCYIGVKTKNGKLTRILSLVCLAETKLRPTRLGRKDLVPENITWRYGENMARESPIDVAEVSRPFQKAVCYWGSGISSRNDQRNHYICHQFAASRLRQCRTTTDHLISNDAGRFIYELATARARRLRVQSSL